MKLRVSFSMGLCGCVREEVIEVPDDELEGLDATAREAELELNAREWMWNFADLSWEEVADE